MTDRLRAWQHIGHPYNVAKNMQSMPASDDNLACFTLTLKSVIHIHSNSAVTHLYGDSRKCKSANSSMQYLLPASEKLFCSVSAMLGVFCEKQMNKFMSCMQSEIQSGRHFEVQRSGYNVTFTTLENIFQMTYWLCRTFSNHSRCNLKINKFLKFGW